MDNIFLLPAKSPLLQATSDVDNDPANPGDLAITIITAGERTQWIGAEDCVELLFRMNFADAATGDVVIEQRGDAGYDTFDTNAVAGVYGFNWNAGEALMGEFRILNSTDQDANTVYAQKRIR